MITDLGWASRSPDDPEVTALARHLERNAGIAGLEILEPSEIDRAVKLFHRDGFVVVDNLLDPDQLGAGVAPWRDLRWNATTVLAGPA